MSLTAWPPLLADLKTDAQIPLDDTRDDVELEQVLLAAVTFVARVHRESYDFGAAPALPAPDATMSLGTCRLAMRWHTRRRSPDALISLGDVGASRVPSFDTDIDRMVRIGRYAPPVFA